jgi:aminoglycoside phosphotransferase (APT) family kinase protein
VPISQHLIVKTASYVDLTEAATLQYIAENISVPVPKVWCSFMRNGRAYLVMERIYGHGFTTDWGQRSQESKDRLYSQLQSMIKELRSLPRPLDVGVQSVTGGSLCDCRVAAPGVRFGPFQTVQGFHKYLRKGIQPEEMEKPTITSEEDWKDVTEMAAKQDGARGPPVFSHGDLSPANVLVRGDNVVGIIDWEFSGWYPEYWEYTSAWSFQGIETEWQDILHNFFEPFPEELHMDGARQRLFGEF